LNQFIYFGGCTIYREKSAWSPAGEAAGEKGERSRGSGRDSREKEKRKK
jgi:hypothetical protein